MAAPVPRLPAVVNLTVAVAGLTATQNVLLNMFEDYFVGGAVTSRVGGLVNDIVRKYSFAEEEEGEADDDDDDDVDGGENARGDADTRIHCHDRPGAQLNYGLFLEFADLIEQLTEDFLGHVDIARLQALAAKEASAPALTKDDILTEIAEMCNVLVDRDDASSFVSIPYVAAALDWERFQEFVYDAHRVAEASVGDCDDDDDDEADEKDGGNTA